LEVAGLVSSRREPAARGRPKRIYTLTPFALTLFPQKSAHLISGVFQAMERSLDTKTINTLIRHTVQTLWQQILPEKPSGSLRDRLADVTQALTNTGGYASLEEEQGSFTIVVRNFIYREAFSTVSPRMSSRLSLEFLRELQRMLGPVRAEWIDIPAVGDHLRRIRITPRKE
jgi:predicted ArsR family transcriptional regulator